MSKSIKTTSEIKALCEKILNFKIQDSTDSKSNPSSGKKISKNSIEDIKKALTQINGLLRKAQTYLKIKKIFSYFYPTKALKN